MWKELAPDIYRQRLVIEGMASHALNEEQMIEYLEGLSRTLGMTTLANPTAHKSQQWGWAAWIHWESSGCHLYSWETPYPFFSADIYTCKAFDVDKAVAYTQEFMKATEITFKEF